MPVPTAIACLVADPPWSFDDKGSRIAPDWADREVYKTMPLDEIAHFVWRDAWVRDALAKDCHLFLWCPDALLFSHAPMVLKAWGDFTVKRLIKWVKIRVGPNGLPAFDGKLQIGMGHYLRGASEVCIHATRGRPAVLAHNVPDVIFAPRTKSPAGTKHSTKPVALLQLAERLCPGPRLELFARQRRAGWLQDGDQLEASAA